MREPLFFMLFLQVASVGAGLSPARLRLAKVARFLESRL